MLVVRMWPGRYYRCLFDAISVRSPTVALDSSPRERLLATHWYGMEVAWLEIMVSDDVSILNFLRSLPYLLALAKADP